LLSEGDAKCHTNPSLLSKECGGKKEAMKSFVQIRPKSIGTIVGAGLSD
jgi:hypothetical protein